MQNPDVVAIKKHASILMESLESMGIKIKRTQALEVIAQLENRTDWNRLQAKLKLTHTNRPVAKLAAAPSEAIFYVSDNRDYRTELLKTLFELECADGMTSPLFISISGDGHLERDGIDFFMAKSDRISIQYGVHGMGYTKESSSPSGCAVGRGILINLKSSTKGSRAGAGLAITQLLRNLWDHAPHHFKGRIGSVLIDSVHQVPQDELDEIFCALGEFARGHDIPLLRLVCSTSTPITASSLARLGLKTLYVSNSNTECMGSTASDLIAHPGMMHYYDSPVDLHDLAIVPHVAWWIDRKDWLEINESYCRKSGESRVLSLPGNAVWFEDIRVSLRG